MSLPDHQPSWLHHTGHETHLLREIMRTQQLILGSFSRAVGIPAARLALIRLLAISGPNGVGVMDLARQLHVNPAAVTHQMASLERDGVVARRSDPTDKRRISMRLTSKGLSMFEKVHTRAHAFEKSLTNSASTEDVAAAIRVLTAVRAMIEKTS